MTKPRSAKRKSKAKPKRKRGRKPRVPREIGAAVPARVEMTDEVPILASIPDERPRGRFRRAWRFFFGPRER